eukprot:Sspe_Gene.26692::Locus_11223_Transcript_1_1_Confidence_1.000_Length_2022::g.26692::m.26692/K00297/metF, MTHFR; methylenetetrahydrofolate reductase (NADPH)
MKLIERIHAQLERDSFFYSFEYFPPKTDAGFVNLCERMERMGELNPNFVGVTWGTEGKTADETLEICETAQNLLGLETQMHITCTNTPISLLADSVRRAKDAGIQNLFVLRGAKANSDEGFQHAVDFIRWIRKEYGDYFGITVAGYPEGHEECSDYQENIRHLKDKVDAGADLVITQLFYDADIFLDFVQDCRKAGIKCPIIPGIMPINTYHQFSRMVKLYCKKKTPAITALNEKLRGKLDDDEVKNVGVQEVTMIIKKLMRKGVRGFHFFTQNLEKSVARILTDAPPDGLGLLDDDGSSQSKDLPCQRPEWRRAFPWRRSANMRRCGEEDVRPAFWANRPKSYMAKTMSWDDFPNGRWGDSRSPAFGEQDYSHSLAQNTKEWLSAKSGLWSMDVTLPDVVAAFVNSLHDDSPKLPWFETSLSSESSRIFDVLLDPMNRHGMLTINSQPGVNGEPSDTKDVGWGPSKGYVYQKEYVEFFCSPEIWRVVKEKLLQPRFPSLTYMATSKDTSPECTLQGVNAVTWGVFVGKEIIQPTVVDIASFMEWKKEAFALWLAPFKPGEERYSPPVIREIYNTWWLVNIVDNDFVKNTELRTLIAEVLSDPRVPLVV